MAQPARLRALYRALLRELPPRPILASPRSHLHSRLRASLSSSSPSSSSSSSSPSSSGPPSPAAQADQLAAYLRSQRLYVSLVERYNPGMGMDEEERVRLTARRVGMDMPLLYRGGRS
ncbi:hypothetical protein E4U41_003043 [Claviceps citrina]|nr:hypothetical protein E4U41_003043 [Claviceps citrina]